MEHTFRDCVIGIKNENIKTPSKDVRRSFFAQIMLLDVAPLCKTDTGGPENYEASLRYWLKVREYDGTETPESLAAEWDMGR